MVKYYLRDDIVFLLLALSDDVGFIQLKLYNCRDSRIVCFFGGQYVRMNKVFY